MTRVAISGHRGLTSEASRLVDLALRRELAPFAQKGDLVGLSCLAEGTDQLFAAAVLDAGGALEVFVPSAHYRDDLPKQAQTGYDDLYGRASAVHQLDRVESTPAAYMDASIEMLRSADRLFAVWDGLPARDFGGTADVVGYAQQLNLPITVIWPEGAARD